MRRQSDTGFTLIELLFAMSFVAVLLIIILSSSLAITRIYNKGITLKQVNQSGASIGAELQTSMREADAPLVTDYVHNGNGNGGRLCLGTYSYVWNLKDSGANQYNGSSNRIGIVKVRDPSKSMCNGTQNVNVNEATELILGASGTLAGVTLQLRNLDITKVANSGDNYIYQVDYTISTNDQSLISATTDRCTGGSNDEFCALNSFSFDVFLRKGGSGKID